MMSGMAAARDRGEPLSPLWRDFAAHVQKTKNTPPYHLRRLLAALTKVRGERAASEVAILDHGCGGGVTLLYLLALGYTGIYGATVGNPREMWDLLLREVFGIEVRRFFIYDGKTLPFADEHFDFIRSQQVLEHVTDELIGLYYAEEERVLKPGGMVFQEVPHRLYPYDSHTRTCFIHWFPRPARLARRQEPDPDRYCCSETGAWEIDHREWHVCRGRSEPSPLMTRRTACVSSPAQRAPI